MAHGANRLPQERIRGPVRRFLAQFESLLIQVLAARAVTAAIGHVNAAVGFVREVKAEQVLHVIGEMLPARATVLLEGPRKEIPAEHVVPGDPAPSNRASEFPPICGSCA